MAGFLGVPLLIFPFERAADAKTDQISPPYTVETLSDPFLPGWVDQTSFTDSKNSARTSFETSFQLGYGWDQGVFLNLVVPVLWIDTPPATKGATTPRIGGANNARIEVDGYFRFWGDARSYFGVELGAALPYQSSHAMENTTNNSWLFPATLLGQYGWHSVALRGTFTDTWTFPAVVSSKYYDQSNSFGFSLTLLGLPESRYSPYFRWTEGFPVLKDVGTDQGASTFLQKEIETNETRSLGLGLDAIPFKHAPVLLGLEANMRILPTNGLSPWSWTGRIRWSL